MYPLERRSDIDGFLNWFLTIMRENTTRLIKMWVGPKAMGEKTYPVEEVTTYLNEFYINILPALE